MKAAMERNAERPTAAMTGRLRDLVGAAIALLTGNPPEVRNRVKFFLLSPIYDGFYRAELRSLVVYLDSSALAKLVVLEPESRALRAYLRRESGSRWLRRLPFDAAAAIVVRMASAIERRQAWATNHPSRNSVA